MHRTILLLPKLVAEPGGSSVLTERLPGLRRLVEHSTLLQVEPIPRCPTPEASFFGLDPRTVGWSQGVLVVSAFKVNPPEGSVVFALDFLSTVDGEKVARPERPIDPNDLGLLWREASKLETRSLTLVTSDGLEGGLIWLDGSLEMRTTGPDRATSLKGNLPEGECESLLRRFIDDSINLLTPHEVNRRRVDEGLLPINLLWPWGQGLMASSPNLALLRGEPAFVVSGSRRVQGLARLVGYRHADPATVPSGINLPVASHLEIAVKEPLSIFVFDIPGRLREAGRLEESAWLTRRIDEEFVNPLLDLSVDEDRLIVVAVPTFESADRARPLGLAAVYRSKSGDHNHVPFDERALEEPLARQELWSIVERAMEVTD